MCPVTPINSLSAEVQVKTPEKSTQLKSIQSPPAYTLSSAINNSLIHHLYPPIVSLIPLLERFTMTDYGAELLKRQLNGNVPQQINALSFQYATASNSLFLSHINHQQNWPKTPSTSSP
jgi:hypothetical protein